jgi:hypothetical protein
MYDGLGKVRAADLNAYGVTGRDKVPTKVDHPMRAIVDRLAGVFGAEEFDLYMHRQRDKGVVIENTASRPSVLLPYWITELPHSQQVFLIAHAMLNLARGTHIIELFSPRDLEVLMTAAGRTAIPEFGGRIATSEVLDECQRQIARGIPRKKRKAFEASAEAYARSRGPDVGTFVQWAQQTARRVALIVADDLLAAVAVVARAEEMGDKKGVALVRASPIISDLLKVWVSKPAMMLRMRTGLIPNPTQE